MSKWYTCFQREIRGPFSRAEIEEKIRSRALSWIHLVCQEGGGGWQLLHQAPEFAPLFPKPKRGEWTILPKNPASGSGPNRMIGPLERSEVFHLLASGDISYSDFAWREGMTSWQRIGVIAALDRRSANTEPSWGEVTTAERPGASSSELLENVVRCEREMPLSEYIPEEAGGRDLLETFFSVPVTKVRV